MAIGVRLDITRHGHILDCPRPLEETLERERWWSQLGRLTFPLNRTSLGLAFASIEGNVFPNGRVAL